MRKTVVARLDLGYTRIAGYLLFDPVTNEFQETTPKIVEKMISAKAVNGMIFDKDGELVPDMEGWNVNNIKIRSGVGNYRDLNTLEPKGGTVYHVVRVLKFEDTPMIFEVVNNKCARVFYTEKQLRALAQFSWIGGVRITDEDIEFCEGVIHDDIKDIDLIDLNGLVYSLNGKINVDNRGKTEQSPKSELEKLFDDTPSDSGFQKMPECDDPPVTEDSETPADLTDVDIEEQLKDLFCSDDTSDINDEKTEENDITATSTENKVTTKVTVPEAVKEDEVAAKEPKKQKSHGKKH